MGLRSPSVYFTLTLVALAIGLLLFVIAFATTYWMVLDTQKEWINLGLWEGTRCLWGRLSRNYDGHCPHVAPYREAWMFAGQALVCLGLIGIVIACILLILYWCVDSCRRRRLFIAAVVFIYVVVFLLVVGIIILAINIERYTFYISWSMGLCIAAAAFFLLAGIMATIHLCYR